MNHIVTAISDRLLPELEARLRLAFEDGPPGSLGAREAPPAGAASIGLPQSQVDRITLLKTALMHSSPMKLASSKLPAYQASIPSPLRAGMLPTGFPSPNLLGGAPHSNSAAAVAPNSATAARSAAPTARLTEEVAASALALNNLQLGVACALQLQRTLQRDVADYFSATAL